MVIYLMWIIKDLLGYLDFKNITVSILMVKYSNKIQNI